MGRDGTPPPPAPSPLSDATCQDFVAPGLPLKIELAALQITTHIALDSFLHSSMPRLSCVWNGRKMSKIAVA